MARADAAWKAIRDRLTTATGAKAYFGGRVYPIALPQSPQLPSATFQVLSAPREHAMGIDPGTVHARVQVDIYDSTYLGSASGGARVREALSRFSGTATGATIHDVFVDNEIERFEEEVEGAEGRVWRRTLDFIVHYEE